MKTDAEALALFRAVRTAALAVIAALEARNALYVRGATGSDQLAEADAKVTAARQAHASARVALVDAAEEG